MSSYEISVEVDEIVVELGNSGGIAQSSLARAGQVSLASGADGGSVSFPTALTTPITGFSLLLTMQNLTDTFPQDLTARVSVFSINGFSFKLSAPTDTANYKVYWALIPQVNG